MHVCVRFLCRKMTKGIACHGIKKKIPFDSQNMFENEKKKKKTQKDGFILESYMIFVENMYND